MGRESCRDHQRTPTTWPISLMGVLDVSILISTPRCCGPLSEGKPPWATSGTSVASEHWRSPWVWGWRWRPHRASRMPSRRIRARRPRQRAILRRRLRPHQRAILRRRLRLRRRGGPLQQLRPRQRGGPRRRAILRRRLNPRQRVRRRLVVVRRHLVVVRRHLVALMAPTRRLRAWSRRRAQPMGRQAAVSRGRPPAEATGIPRPQRGTRTHRAQRGKRTVHPQPIPQLQRRRM